MLKKLVLISTLFFIFGISSTFHTQSNSNFEFVYDIKLVGLEIIEEPGENLPEPGENGGEETQESLS